MATNSKTTSGIEETKAEDSNQTSDKLIRVYIRVMFLRIGEIDTLNENFHASIHIEARWSEEFDKLSLTLSSQDRKRLTDGKNVTLPKYAQSHWHPQLSIDNAFGDLKQQIRYSAKKARKKDNEVYLCEHRDVKGLFWEKLELQHFPSDVQNLSISIASMFYDDKVILIPDSHHLSGINRETFVDQQEWYLYERVATEQKYIKEFPFQAADDEEDDGEDGQPIIDNEEYRKRSVLTITFHAARRSNYFYWNAYFLILLITLLTFCSYALPPNQTSSRIEISCTLLLTSIAFRWTVNRSLPAISYLTSMDIYALLCIFILVTQTLWHAIIGSLIYGSTRGDRVPSYAQLLVLDQYICWISIIGFILIHVALIAWLYFVPFKKRKILAQNDMQYHLLLSEKNKKRRKTQFSRRQSKDFSTYSRIPIE